MPAEERQDHAHAHSHEHYQERLRLPAGESPVAHPYVHELATFPNAKHDDQADSTSQALDWMKSFLFEPPIVQFYRKEAEKRKAEQQRTEPDQPPRLTREWYYRTHGMR